MGEDCPPSSHEGSSYCFSLTKVESAEDLPSPRFLLVSISASVQREQHTCPTSSCGRKTISHTLKNQQSQLVFLA